jgi:hypothetical protein
MRHPPKMRKIIRKIYPATNAIPILAIITGQAAIISLTTLATPSP